MASMSQLTPKIYRWADNLSGVLVLFLVVFAPWALGPGHLGALVNFDTEHRWLPAGWAAGGKVVSAESYRV